MPLDMICEPSHTFDVPDYASFTFSVNWRMLFHPAGSGVQRSDGAGAGPTKAQPQPVHRNRRTGEKGLTPARKLGAAQVARLVAGSLQALGPAAPMAQTWNQYWVPLVRPVTVQLEALPT